MLVCLFACLKLKSTGQIMTKFRMYVTLLEASQNNFFFFNFMKCTKKCFFHSLRYIHHKQGLSLMNILICCIHCLKHSSYLIHNRYMLTDNNYAVSNNDIKVKVKVTLVQALRLCTGHTANRGSRGRALPFHDHDTRRWGVSVMLRPLFTLRKDPVPIVQEAGCAPGSVWTGAENLVPAPGFDPRTVQLVARR